MNPRTIINILDRNKREELKRKLYSLRYWYHKKFILGKYTPNDFKTFLMDKLSVREGTDTLVHSSFDALVYWGLTPNKIISILKEIIGNGTLLMPSFPTRHTDSFIRNYSIFDAKNTPSKMGLLSEIFRIKNQKYRSLDPIRPFVAQGNLAEYYISDHHKSIYSYDKDSPLYKLAENNGMVIGLGAPLQNHTLVHTIENLMKESFPLKVNEDKIYQLNVKDSSGNIIQVDKKVLKFDPPPKDIKKYSHNFRDDILYTFKHHLSSYFYCKAGRFLERGIDLAKKNITIYR